MDDISSYEEQLEESGDDNDIDFASDSSGSEFYEKQIVPVVSIYSINTLNHYLLNCTLLSFSYAVV